MNPGPWKSYHFSNSTSISKRKLKFAVTFRPLLIAFLGFMSMSFNSTALDFNTQVRPILSDHCFQCHGPDANHRKANLRLDTQEGLFGSLTENDDSDQTNLIPVTPGNLEKSEIWKRIQSQDPDEIMPPPEANKPLSAEQVSILKSWILEGAPYESHWAFISPDKPDVPDFSNETKWNDWVRNPIDAFILKKMLEAGLVPSPEAPLNLLIRRVSLDLQGLPPQLDRLDALLAQRTVKSESDIYESWVLDSLASPHYGERMVWPWLDAARYADSNGYQADRERTMWPWRDWAIQAFNKNMPFDQFTIYQIAGDLLPDSYFKDSGPDSSAFEAKLATGFLRNHMINGEGGRIAEENRVDYVLDMTETVGTIWMGLTVGCSRCHDHKFDPISQQDYYALSGFFNQTPVNGGGGDPQTPPVLAVPDWVQSKRLDELEKQRAAALHQIEEIESLRKSATSDASQEESADQVEIPENTAKILERSAGSRDRNQLSELREFYRESDPHYADSLSELASILKSLEDLNRSIPKVMVMEDRVETRPTYILNRGLYNLHGEEVNIGLPEFLSEVGGGSGATSRAQKEGHRFNRLDLAEWLVHPDHPLMARVIVNRFWQMFFGNGLVRTPEDFGSQGKPPTHPELLDWLAIEFQEQGWDVKWLVHTLVTSSTYRQSASVSPEKLETDPQNLWLSRSPRYRWPSWMIRDQALAAVGLLDRTIGGEPVYPYQPEGVWAEATFGNKRYRESSGKDLYRRSVYTFWRRIVGPTQFFDAAKRQVCEVKPTRTNSPLHALQTWNDPAYVEAARHMAESLPVELNDQERLNLIYRITLSRDPSKDELQILTASLNRLRSQYNQQPESASQLLTVGATNADPKQNAIESAAWTALVSMVLNLDETLSKP